MRPFGSLFSDSHRRSADPTSRRRPGRLVATLLIALGMIGATPLLGAAQSAVPSFIEVIPEFEGLLVGTEGSLTAEVFDEVGDPVAGVTVEFEVYRDADRDGALEALALSASDVTGDGVDDDGETVVEDVGVATFDYTGPASAARDQIAVCVDAANDGCASIDVDGFLVMDPDDVGAGAFKSWGQPAYIELGPDDETLEVGTEGSLNAFIFNDFDESLDGVMVEFEVYRDPDRDGDLDSLALSAADVTGDGVDDDGDPVFEDVGVATFDYTGPSASADDQIAVCVDADNDGCAVLDALGNLQMDPDDIGAVATKQWRETGAPSFLIVSPETQNLQVGTEGTLTAQVFDEVSLPVDGVTVEFEVYRDADLDGTYDSQALTAADMTGDGVDDDGDPVVEDVGVATFDYTGPLASARDAIVACVDADNDGCASIDGAGAVMTDPDNIAGQAAKGWTQLATEDISGPLSPDDLAQQLAGAGVTISNVTYTGSDLAAGKFSGGTSIIGFGEGVILSSGNVANVRGPNQQDGVTGSNGTAGDADLSQLSGFNTLDAAVLEFDFVPNNAQLSFNYVFASDEYNEYVNSQFNDVFGFFVNGTNCARVNGDPVSINTINNGNPYNTDPRSHPDLFRNNDLGDGGGTIDTEMDGLTRVLLCQATVTPNATNHMKLAIADASDRILDSNVFLQAGSITTDLAAPRCRVTARRTGPPAEIDVTVQDPAPGSGLASVQVILAENANVLVPSFTAGTNDPVVVTATKINQTQQARIGLRVTDTQGRTTRCTSAGVILF